MEGESRVAIMKWNFFSCRFSFLFQDGREGEFMPREKGLRIEN